MTPTGWEVVLDLIQRVAQVEGKLEECAPDPPGWYQRRFNHEPDYSDLLEQLAKTPAERQQLLRGYFEPTEEERAEATKVPTDAHRALAELVAGGYVRVIVTTNFDRLMEQALEAEGITPAVLSTSDAITGAMPLAHSRCTVVKLHGDYMDTRILNTLSELKQYDEATNRLLDQVLDEYGLIVSGWSADWDAALRAAIERAPNRRFSAYWAYPRTLTDAAQRLIAHRNAIPISGMTANAFFRKLAEDIKSLEAMSGPRPLSAKLAAQSVKRYIPEERERIRLHDLVMGEVARIRELVAGPNSLALHGAFSEEELAARMQRLETESASLMAMLAVAGYWVTGTNLNLWGRALGRLADLPTPPGGYMVAFESLRRYPALLGAYATGIAAVAAGSLGSLVSLFAETMVEDSNESSHKPFVVAVNTSTVLASDFQRRLPGREKHLTPFSAHLWSDSGLQGALREVLADEQAFTAAFDRFEYLAGLLAHDLDGWAPKGCFIWRDRGRGMTQVTQVNDEMSEMGEDWPLLRAGAFGGSLERLRMTKSAYDSTFVHRFA